MFSLLRELLTFPLLVISMFSVLGGGDDNFLIIAIFDVFWLGGTANLSITDIFFVFFVVGGAGRCQPFHYWYFLYFHCFGGGSGC